jgi:4-phospho-D-threonate 3-dehydrogenase / 4-phospho-D-erythronate 3-dehydrogenase
VPLVTAWWPGASARRQRGIILLLPLLRRHAANRTDPPMSASVVIIADCQARGWCRGRSRPTRFFFRASRGDFDIVVAMYHDQGHGPVKVLGIEAGVNITVGLPVIRTSVDHGTAFDIAGTGKADERGLLVALCQAAELAPKRP